MRVAALIVALVLGTGVLAFHPGRPLYMQNRAVQIAVDDGVILQGTISKPRWSRKPVPGVVVVHGSGPLTRNHLAGDVRRLVRRGFAVLAYDKRGAGASSGMYLQSASTPPAVLLRRLAADAAAAFDQLAAEPEVDTTRLGFFGASQAGWIIPLAAELTHARARFHILLSGPAVSTAVEQYYSDLTGDGTPPARVTDRAEVERLTLAFRGDPGFDPAPVLQLSRVPTLWLLGDRDESVPTFASVRVLDSLRATGNNRHTVIRYAHADHHLRDVATGDAVPIWDDMMAWLEHLPPGCLAAESAPALDHVVLVVHDLERASVPFMNQGFRLKNGRLHPNQLLNRHIKFRDGSSIELMTLQGEPGNAMAQRYADLLAAGEGGVYVAFNVADIASLQRGAGELGLATHQSASGPWQFLGFPASSPAAAVFFSAGGFPANDPDSLVAHQPAVSGLAEAWVEGGADLVALLRRQGATRCGPAKTPRGLTGERLALKRGTVVITQARAGVRPRVLGVVLRSESADTLIDVHPSFWIQYRPMSN